MIWIQLSDLYPPKIPPDQTQGAVLLRASAPQTMALQVVDQKEGLEVSSAWHLRQEEDLLNALCLLTTGSQNGSLVEPLPWQP